MLREYPFLPGMCSHPSFCMEKKDFVPKWKETETFETLNCQFTVLVHNICLTKQKKRK